MRIKIECMVSALLVVAFSVIAQAQPKAPEVEQINLTVHPAPLPVPAMRYHLVPELVDQTSGNAALLYLSAAQQVAIERAADPSARADDDKIFQWLAVPIAELPREQVQTLLDRYSAALKLMRLASLRDRCDFDPPYRTEGFRTQLPYLVDARSLARLGCLSARLKIARGNIDGAVADLALPLIQAGHLNQGEPFMVQLLVAASCVQYSLVQMQDLISQDHSPNLYWALGDLPLPLLNARATMKMERAGAYFSVPELKDARTGKLTAEQWRGALAAMVQMGNGQLHSYGGPTGPDQFALALRCVQEYPIAKQYLLGQKMPLGQIDAMSAAQVLGLYHVGQFEYWTQELDKCLTLPYWQALPLLDQAEQEMRRAATGSPWSLISVFAPAIKMSYTNIARTDRRIAMVRTVEAIRAYAAGHDGQTPARLDDLVETPAPLDPMTGKAFVYAKDGDEITIEGPTIELAGSTQTGIRITLKVVR